PHAPASAPRRAAAWGRRTRWRERRRRTAGRETTGRCGTSDPPWGRGWLARPGHHGRAFHTGNERGEPRSTAPGRGPGAHSMHVPGGDLYDAGPRAVGGAASASAPCGLTAAATFSDGGRGSRTVKRAPRPGPSLAASIVPPCSSTRSRAIERPRPRPPWRRVL